MPIRRVLSLSACAIFALMIAYTGWQLFQVQRELRQAQASVGRLQSAIEAGDASGREEALKELQSAAGDADDRTNGIWWSVLTRLPIAGDDARGIRALSHAVSSVADEALPSVVTSADALDGLVVDGRVDLDVVTSLQEPVSRASRVLAEATEEIAGVDSSGFFGALRVRYRDLVDQFDDAASGLRSADTALQVLPAMAGADGPRDYLLLFQNNAEIRATGGMPGSWAQLHADNGELELREQGTAGEFPRADQPVVPLTPAESAVYGIEYGVFFQNPGYSPDFQRGAEIWRAHWDARYPKIDLDGVLAVDPVALSYLLRGTGPITVEDRTLTSDNAVEELLSRPYLDLEPTAQDEFFAEAARSIFDGVTGDLDSPFDLVEGLAQAAREGRFLVAPFDEQVLSRLQGTRVLGELSGDDRSVPHIDIGINDGGASKMSYYLRYAAELESTSCTGGKQQISGQMRLSQTISPQQAATLPVSVTGAGSLGIEPGQQAVFVRLYGPAGGEVGDIMIDGKRVALAEEARIDDRQVITLLIEIATDDDVFLTWTVETGENQTSPVRLNMTPGVASGNHEQTFASSC